MTSELVAHVDKHDQLLGLVERARAYKEGLPHRSVHALIHSSDDLFLLQQRSSTKQTWPGKWDLSLGETVKGTEPFEQALERGLREELGITQPLQPQLLHNRYYCEWEWPPYKVYGVICLFTIEYSGQIKLEDGEVQAIKWIPQSEVTELVTNQPELCTPWLVSDWQYYLAQRAK